MNDLSLILSIQVGRLQSFENDSDRPWKSGIIKTAVSGPVMMGTSNVDGDEQADLVHHGGIDKAALSYPHENYAIWKAEFPEIGWTAGSFGENLTTQGMTESDACVGDVYRAGNCVLQVSQPRQPCWKLSKRWGLPKLAVRVQKTRRTGWYYRVLQEGVIEAGQSLRLDDRPLPEWTILAANEIMYGKSVDPIAEAELAACPLLSKSWRDTLGQRVARRRKRVAPEQPE